MSNQAKYAFVVVQDFTNDLSFANVCCGKKLFF